MNSLYSIFFLDAVPPMCSFEYWKSVIQNGIGCTIGSFLAIWISYKIYRRTTRKADLDRVTQTQQENIDILLNFKRTIQAILSISKNQTENIKKFVSEIHKNDLEIPLFSFIPIYNLKRVAENNLDTLLIVYRRQFPGEESLKIFNNIISNIEDIYSQFLLLPEQLAKVQMYDHERKTKFQEIFAESFAILGQYMLTQDPANPSAAAKEIEPTMIEFQQKHSDNYDIDFYYKYFLVPMNDTMVALLSGLDKNQKFVELAQSTRNGKQMYHYIKSQNRKAADDLAEVVPHIED